ncbi:tricalbin [Obba rivulosa]|uniref:Tricalbin n=1 Tax=Obba rivulosa TaxID=1052685 RepID=A0A8E2DIT5_9APHY|nr:tricalbin [Obba rivulosa]
MATVNGNAPHPDPHAQLNGVLEGDAAKNRVAVHTFDPDASPEQKAAAAGKGKEKLKRAKDDAGPSGREVAVDTGNSNVIPTITVHDVDKAADSTSPVSPAAPSPASSGEASVPGAIPAGPAPAIPDWYKVGWQAVAEAGTPIISEGEEKEMSTLAQFVNEQYYGDWYHNAALIVAAVVIAHFFTRFNFGWGWLFLLLAFCNTYYTTSLRRFRQRARDDIQRELVKTGLETESESADWMNNFLDRFWLIYEPVLSQTIIASVDQVLSTNCPTFLDSLRLTTFTLGTKAPHIDRVKTSPRTADDIVLMDWSISFTPNDTSDMTERQKKDKVNPKIVLSVRVGKGVASATMPILLEDITFSGHMRIRLKLMTTFPHIQLVDISFLEKPVIDYVLKPIGGETFGFDIGYIPGLSAFIRDMVHATLGPMMYDPNVFTLNLEQMLSGEPLDAAIGVLQITVHSARNIKGVKIGGGTPDPYVSISINDREELARTKYKHNTVNPSWSETKFILVNTLTESLILSLFDYNDHRKNTLLGSASFDMSKLREDATQEGIEAPILKDGKERGTLRFDVTYYPVLKPEVDAGGKEELPESKVGIVRMTLHQAKDLDHTKSMSNDLNPFAKVYVGGSPHAIHACQRVKHTNNPVWESSTEFLCSDRSASVITVKVIDDRDFLKDPVIGYMSIRLEDLFHAKQEAGRDWWPLSGCRSGRMRLSAEWKPLNMAGSLHGADQYVPPIGVVRLWLQKATDVKNVEATLGGKSDPYVRVQINNITHGRTEVVNNNLNPQWDQILYIPVHSLKETMMLECMDYQHLTKDRSLGYVDLKVSDLAQPSDGGEFPYASTGKKAAADPLRLSANNYKGHLHYEAEFVPALPFKFKEFSTHGNELQHAVENSGEDDGDTVYDDASSVSSRHDNGAFAGITVSEPLGEDEKAPEKSPERPPAPAQGNGHKRTGSDVTAETAFSTAESMGTTAVNGANTQSEERRLEQADIELSKEELLKHQSGVIAVNVISGQLQKKARLEVLLDDAYWPAFSTIRPRSTKARWGYIGEGFIKELDFGRVWLRLNEADEGDKDDIIAEWRGDAKVFLQQALDGPTKYTLLHKEDEDKKSEVEVEARYIPVPIKLEPRESINNQGVLRVDLLDGAEIRGVDRGGKSDPFVVFQLNGQKVYKSQTKKKTLSPEWNENFLVQVPSRVGADFTLEVFDWNQIEQAKSLGSGSIDLSDLEPFQAAERSIPLSHAKHGEKGSVRVRLLFQPEIIVKTRKNTSTFSTAGRAMTQIGHLPVGAGKGVIQGVTGVFKKEKDFARGPSPDLSDDDKTPTVSSLPSGQASEPIGATGAQAADGMFAAMNGSAAQQALSSEPGTLRVTVLDAKDLSTSDTKPYVVLRVGDKECKTKSVSKTAAPEWNETFAFSAAPGAQPKLYAWIFDHKTLGKDKQLGSAEIDLWRHLQPGSGVNTAEVLTELREGQGLLRFQMEFDPNTLTRSKSRSSFQSGDVSPPKAPTSPSRFSLSRRKGADSDD